MARRRRGRYSALGEDEGLNLTPLLDVIFNLIFFFVLATTIRSEESFFDLQLPEASESTPQQLESVVPEILISGSGTVIYEGRELTHEELLAQLKSAVEKNKTTKAVVSADADARVQDTVNVMDVLRKAGIKEMTQRVRTKK